MIQRHTYGYFYGLLSAALYASVSIVAKHLITGGAHPFVILFYQYVFTAAILGIWHLIRNPRALRCDMKKIGYFAILGVAGGGATNLLFYSSLGYLDAGIGSMLLFLHPVFITVFFAVSKIKAMKPINFFCTLMAAFGAAIVLNVFSGSLSFPVAGVALIVFATILLHRTESAKTPEDAKDENHESPSDPKAAGKPE